jgi:hypothetical protein
MKRREMLFLVSGLVIGLVFGMILVGSDDSLRESIFGTAGSVKKTNVNYYLVDLEQAQTWLSAEYPQNSDELKAAFDKLSLIPVSVVPNTDFIAAEEDIAYLLPQAYAALVGEKNVDTIQPKSGDSTAACLGLDDDPYAGATLYFYLTIPSDAAKKMDFTKDWEKLTVPQTNVLYWKLLACYPDTDVNS